MGHHTLDVGRIATGKTTRAMHAAREAANEGYNVTIIQRFDEYTHSGNFPEFMVFSEVSKKDIVHGHSIIQIDHQGHGAISPVADAVTLRAADKAARVLYEAGAVDFKRRLLVVDGLPDYDGTVPNLHKAIREGARFGLQIYLTSLNRRWFAVFQDQMSTLYLDGSTFK